MKIVILGPAHPLRPGGITTFNERLCRAFTNAGHDCSIWSFSLQYPSFLFPGSSQFTDAPAPADIRIRTLINSIDPLNWWKTGNLLKNERPDLVIVRYWIPFMGACLGTILRRVKGNRHTRIICIADNVVPHEERPGDVYLTRYFVKPVDAFVVMSDQVMKDLRTFTRAPAILLPHPLYDNFGEKVTKNVARETLQEKFKISVGENTPLLVFFGLVRAYKGLDLLIEALHLTENKQVQLVVAGEFYEEEQPYLDMIDRYGMKERIHLHATFIAEADVRYFICAADCIIQPYKNATQSGVTPVAYHFEVPMIVTNVGGLPQMVPDGKAGIVCQPSAPSIADAIHRFFQAGPEYFGPGLSEEKKKLSWDSFIGGILQLADSL
ncbi:MAG TPA: glycosyltransferase [Phnomibacter sp.]|nr:glycosyltransferase [Phnomibacter sp.]